MPKISVCIPVYNVEKFIRRCLESVLNQSVEDIEVVVVNDCTPDHSMEIVREFAQKDKRIKMLENQQNRGLMITRRVGYMAATGDYITFCDSDDTLPAGALEALYNEAVKTDADIVSGVIEYVSVTAERSRWKNRLSYGNDKISVFKSLLTDEFPHNLYARLYKSALIQNYEYETYEHATNGEDGMLFYQVIEHVGHVATIDKVVYEYRQNVESSTHVRFKDHALRSIAQLNALRIRIATKYPKLSKLAYRKVVKNYWSLKLEGYNIKEHYLAVGLENYSLLHLFVTQPLRIFLRILAKSIILNISKR